MNIVNDVMTRRAHVHRESLFPPKVKSAKMRVYKLEGQVCI